MLKRLFPSLILCIAAALGCQLSVFAQAGPTARQAWQELQAFKGRDLWELGEAEKEKIQSLANRIVAGRKQASDGSDVWFRRPRLFGEVGAAKFFLLDSQVVFISPGQAVHFLYLFGEAGTVLGTFKFSTGWRMMPHQVRLVRRDESRHPLLEISASGFGGFALAPGLRQYYALRGGDFLLVRLEDEDSKISRNGYGCEYPSVGPPVPQPGGEELAKALASEDEADVLRALMWLGGQHETVETLIDDHKDDPEGSTLKRCPEAMEDAKLFAAAAVRPEIRESLRTHAASPNIWIREAAELALDPQTKRR
jgi:hypothetical protein